MLKDCKSNNYIFFAKIVEKKGEKWLKMEKVCLILQC